MDFECGPPGIADGVSVLGFNNHYTGCLIPFDPPSLLGMDALRADGSGNTVLARHPGGKMKGDRASSEDDSFAKKCGRASWATLAICVMISTVMATYLPLFLCVQFLHIWANTVHQLALLSFPFILFSLFSLICYGVGSIRRTSLIISLCFGVPYIGLLWFLAGELNARDLTGAIISLIGGGVLNGWILNYLLTQFKHPRSLREARMVAKNACGPAAPLKRRRINLGD